VKISCSWVIPILHGLFLHSINCLVELVEQKYLVDVVGPILDFFNNELG